jgi:hypothetical protein
MKGKRPHNKMKTKLFNHDFDSVTEAMKYFKLSYIQYKFAKNNPERFLSAEELKMFFYEEKCRKISETKMLKKRLESGA